MNKSIGSILLLSLCAVAGCENLGTFALSIGKSVQPIVAHRKLSGANIPLECRWRNYNHGSCVYASGETVLSACGQDGAAKWMRENYSGGSSCSTLEKVWQRKGFKTKATYSCDMKFLQWCVDHRVPAAIEYFGGHCVTFVGMDKQWVYLLDNNGPREKLRPIPRKEFEGRGGWSGYGGNACTIVSKPTVPMPYIPKLPHASL